MDLHWNYMELHWNYNIVHGYEFWCVVVACRLELHTLDPVVVVVV